MMKSTGNTPALREGGKSNPDGAASRRLGQRDGVLRAIGLAGLALALCGWFAVPHWANVAVPAGGLMVLAAARGEVRWVARPYFIAGPPPRWLAWLLAALCALWLVAGVASHL
jgi:hypothetical protein